MTKTYTLDLSKVDLSANWPSNVPLKLTLCDGKHQKDFDLIEEHTIELWYSDLVDYITGGFDIIYNTEIPIGLNFASLPKNATLTKN